MRALNYRRLAGRVLVFGSLAAVASVFFLNACHLIFDCGCVSLWNGGAAFCNIQEAGPPDCPFCAHPDVAYGALYGTMAAQALVVFLPGSWALGRRALLGLLAFPLVVGGTGVVFGLGVGYWS